MYIVYISYVFIFVDEHKNKLSFRMHYIESH